jgi:hydrogenase maturation factor HypF (carbamoyltransferase family)
VKPGFAFDVYKFASEHNIAGHILYKKGSSCNLQLEGNINDIISLITWFFSDEIDNNLLDSISIKSRQVLDYKDFKIKNLGSAQEKKTNITKTF